MVLQLCGRVCRRLSFENPSSIDEGFFVLKSFFGLYGINPDQSFEVYHRWCYSYLLRSNPFFLAIDVLRKCSKLLRKTLYFFVDQLKERMSQKNTDNDLEKELAYCKVLETRIKKEPSIISIPAVKE